MSDEYLQRGLKFTDLTTIAERMRGKKIISKELLGKNVGWIRMSFVTYEESDGLPTKVIVATQIIDEEKKNAEQLYQKSYVDELTGCYNRRAYSNDYLDSKELPQGKEFVYISFDVNGLKTVNDNQGHVAGDELLKGAAGCMMTAFGEYGRIYRIGGDEFVGVIFADAEKVELLCKDFEDRILRYDGEFIKAISVSYGCVTHNEMENMTLQEIANLADKRMYESKAEHYRLKGIDRRHN